MVETKPTMTVGHAIVPDGYTMTDREQRLLDWSYAEQRLGTARNFWVATVRPNGRPHVTPTWAVWHEGRIYFDGSPETRRMRNIAENPHVTIHLDDGDEVLILDGIVNEHGRPSPELAARLVEVYSTKYAGDGYSPEVDLWNEGGLYEFRPQVVLAWTEFGVDMTRWKFNYPK